YHPGLVRETDNYTNFIIAAENEGCPIYTDDEVDPGDYINISSTTTFQILHINKYASDSNDASIVIKTSYGSVDFLFTGDISSSVESELINSPFDLDSDILKVAHHGSKYSTYDAFLDATTPSVGIISVGSSYGHPTEETLTRLANHKVEVYRTDYNGTVTVTTNGETWSVECERENNPPVAGFTYHTDNITAYFTDISSDPDGDVLTYDWDFGDGNTSEEQNPIHIYSAEGTYNVTLIVSDGKASDSTSKYVTITQQPSTGHIVINEIEQNPYGDDAGNEWVELFNPTDSAIDVSGWKLQTTHGNIETHYIPEETTINSGGYLVITFNKQFLDNNGDSVILFDRNSNEIDRTPVVGDSHDDSRSWQRTPNGYDSDSPSDWQFKYATEGYSNS
ncbi:MAG TPA: PKD domain-containing protein, partial [Methylophaga sp.]|nr:PKD domain-containing protein [Methylophaga sp.]